ncbi:MAG: 50S ribosomal protein L9 [Actinomycetota bacterium]
MDVILKQDVENLGQKGEVVRVAPGYARNFLFPRELAVAATEGNLNNLKHFIAAAEKKRDAERETARETAAKLEALDIRIAARTGEKGRLFGSVTGQDIADFTNAALDLSIGKHKVAAGGGIKTLGKHKVAITVYPGVIVEKEIEVVAAEGGEPEEESSQSAKKTKKTEGKKARKEKAKTEKVPQSASRGEATDLTETQE